jgi:hypothetical protein
MYPGTTASPAGHWSATGPAADLHAPAGARHRADVTTTDLGGDEIRDSAWQRGRGLT